MSEQGQQKAGKRNSGGKDSFNQAGGAENDNNPNARPMTLAEAVAAVQNALPSYSNGPLKIGREEIVPTANQKKLINEVRNKDIVFVDGPFGTGKTFWSCYVALEGLANGKYDRIALTAPAVDADEEIGFLKGSKDEKMEVHVNQILESIDDLIGKPLRTRLQAAGIVEIAPHAFNRGRTYKYTCYILDECQNASARQLMNAIGRLGKASTFIFMGDNKQNDRTSFEQTAFVGFMARFSDAAYAREIGVVQLKKEDCRRHPLLHKILERGDDRPLEGFENRKDSKMHAAPAAAPQPKP